MKSVIDNTVVEYNPTCERVRQIMRKAGSNFGTVHFVKKSTGKMRKMSYRVGVKKPKWSMAPGTSGVVKSPAKNADTLMTVYDVNKVHRDNQGNVIRDEDGKVKRGAYRTVPLDRVTMVVVKGVRYQIRRDDD